MPLPRNSAATSPKSESRSPYQFRKIRSSNARRRDVPALRIADVEFCFGLDFGPRVFSPWLLLLRRSALPASAGGVRIRDLVMVSGRARQPTRRLRPGGRPGGRWRQGSGLHQANHRQHAPALRHHRPGHHALLEERRRRHGHGRHPGVHQTRRAARRAGRLDGRRQIAAGRRAAADARCSARTTRSMPWRRARCPSAASPPAPAAAAAPPSPRTTPPSARSSTARWSSGKSPPPSSATTPSNCCCASRVSPPPRGWPRPSIRRFTNSAQAMDSTSVRVRIARRRRKRAGGFHRPPRGHRSDARHAGAHHHQRAHRHHRGHRRASGFPAAPSPRATSPSTSPPRSTSSQPNPFSNTGTTTVTPRTDTKVTENKGRHRHAAGIADGGEGGLRAQRAGRDAARHDGDLPGHEAGRRVAGRIDHPLIWTSPRSRPTHVDAADLPLDQLAGKHQRDRAAEDRRGQPRLRGDPAAPDPCRKPRNRSFKSKFIGNTTTDGIYRDLVVNQLADSISKSGSFGLAKSLAGELQHQTGAVRTTASTLPAATTARLKPLQP